MKPQSGRSAGGHTPADGDSSSILIYAIRHWTEVKDGDLLGLFFTEKYVTVTLRA